MMQTILRGVALLLWLVMLTVGARAQDRPFLFSVTTATDLAKPALRLDYDIGAGERTFQSGTGNQPEQRIGIHGSRGRLTMLARVGLVAAGSSYQSSQAGELLVSLVDPSGPWARRLALAAGGGVLHEAGGTDVLLARVIAGHGSDAWRLDGNLLLQKPLASDRDAIDVITTIGWARRITPAMTAGVEAIGEDLEGFWDSLEAEGGARLLVGPSLHIAAPGRKWQFTATGGPTFHPSTSGRSSGALRDLPPGTRRVGYAVKAGLTWKVF
jgi:hypothetical protein